MSTSYALLVDFGSTYTKLRAVDLKACRIVASAQAPSTVDSDISAGLALGLRRLEEQFGTLPNFRHRLASSSAAGGLRMIAAGLVRDLTTEAARRAALGAGAKLTETFSHRLIAEDVRRIVDSAPDIILLAGGTDGGNGDVILENAQALATSNINCPVILAGNRVARDEAQDILTAQGKTVVATENVMPEINVLNIEPAREAIRSVFLDHIVRAKGIDRVQGMLDEVLMPTPAAVLSGARLLAEGYGGKDGLGELILVDVGGATTDVHSIAHGAPTRDGVIVQGLPEPYDKRTVEGDLGLRHNVATIVEQCGAEAIAHSAGSTVQEVGRVLTAFQENVERVPTTANERAIDDALASAAVTSAAARHAGSIETVYTANGAATVQRGKDLSEIGALVGTGGVFVHSRNPVGILRAALASSTRPNSLLPRNPILLLDQEYLLYACGLLSTKAPEAALELGLRSLTHLNNEIAHGHNPAA